MEGVIRYSVCTVHLHTVYITINCLARRLSSSNRISRRTNNSASIEADLWTDPPACILMADDRRITRTVVNGVVNFPECVDEDAADGAQVLP